MELGVDAILGTAYTQLMYMANESQKSRSTPKVGVHPLISNALLLSGLTFGGKC